MKPLEQSLSLPWPNNIHRPLDSTKEAGNVISSRHDHRSEQIHDCNNKLSLVFFFFFVKTVWLQTFQLKCNYNK